MHIMSNITGVRVEGSGLRQQIYYKKGLGFKGAAKRTVWSL